LVTAARATPTVTAPAPDSPRPTRRRRPRRPRRLRLFRLDRLGAGGAANDSTSVPTDLGSAGGGGSGTIGGAGGGYVRVEGTIPSCSTARSWPTARTRLRPTARRRGRSGHARHESPLRRRFDSPTAAGGGTDAAGGGCGGGGIISYNYDVNSFHGSLTADPGTGCTGVQAGGAGVINGIVTHGSPSWPQTAREFLGFSTQDIVWRASAHRSLPPQPLDRLGLELVGHH